MSFIHYLFLGHFEHDGRAVRMVKSPSDSIYRPAIQRPLDSEAIRDILREMKGTSLTGADFPEEWNVWLDEGYLICDKYTRNREVIEFLRRLVERVRCDIYDVSAHCEITLPEWLKLVAGSPSASSVGPAKPRNIRKAQ